MATEQVSFPGVPGLPLPAGVPQAPAPEIRPEAPDAPAPEVRPSATQEPQAKLNEEPPPAQLKLDQKHLESLGKMLEGLGDRLEFGVLEQSGQLFVKVVDRQTNEVVKLRPAREFLELKEKMAAAIGLLLDERT